MAIRKSIYTFDVESSSLGMGAYPLTIGVCGPMGKTVNYLIKPEFEWRDWDEISESIHKIRHADAVNKGHPGFLVARELNRRFKDKTLIADSLHDIRMIARLYETVGMNPTFRYKLIREVFGPRVEQEIMLILDDMVWPHESDKDARNLRNIIVLLTDGSYSDDGR